MKRGPNRERRLPWPSALIPNVTDTARRTGIHRTQWQRWKRTGIPLSAARRVADALGSTPEDIWGEGHTDWWEAAA